MDVFQGQLIRGLPLKNVLPLQALLALLTYPLCPFFRILSDRFDLILTEHKVLKWYQGVEGQRLMGHADIHVQLHQGPFCPCCLFFRAKRDLQLCGQTPPSRIDIPNSQRKTTATRIERRLERALAEITAYLTLFLIQNLPEFL